VRNTSKDVRDSIKRKYQGYTKVKRAQLQPLRSKFEALAMKEGESVNDYFSKMLTIANNMSSHRERKDETLIVKKILRSMTSRFNYVVCFIGEPNDVTIFYIDGL